MKSNKVKKINDASMSLAEKIDRYGTKSVSDAELVSMFLTGRGGDDSMSLARYVLGKFGSLRGLMNADVESLTGVSGVGKSTGVKFQAMLELSRRYLFEEIEKRGEFISSPSKAIDYLKLCLRDQKNECFFMVFMDTRLHVTHQCSFEGSIRSCDVPIREVVKLCLKHNCNHLLISHNHPGLSVEPSVGDIRLTNTLIEVLSKIDVKLIDHILIAGDEAVSIAQTGRLIAS